jgi:energy-coupling factor transporter ATP-binding protein EcfA2
MKILVKNLGPLKQADFELGELTIICGHNNTGKTYATYALFGFLSEWKRLFSIDVPYRNIQQLLTEGVTELDIQTFLDDAQNISNFERTLGTMESQLFSISKMEGKSKIIISLLVDKEKVRVPASSIKRVIGDSLCHIIFNPIFPKPFIASAERTGAAIFRKELNFARNQLLEMMGRAEKAIDPFELLNNEYSDYALPVKRNVDFTRHLEDISKKVSFISEEYPTLLDDFSDIIGGKYIVKKNEELYYIPNSKKNIQLTMDESSSAVRSLLDIGFYLRHVAQKGDLLIIDEPELNLHPENQRRLARLFSRLINVGIKVFITTHSDYIIKELNTLIMLNQDKPYLKKICQDEKYQPEELISANKIRVYIAEKKLLMLEGKKKKSLCQTLTAANIDSNLGIEASSFDTTINEMNRIQDLIIWGDE